MAYADFRELRLTLRDSVFDMDELIALSDIYNGLVELERPNNKFPQLKGLSSDTLGDMIINQSSLIQAKIQNVLDQLTEED
ncbi:MAG: hypothetical protein LBS60_09110 [Deltaproteobacteria bacterium]|jgi:hypothetical protein|nr:hypothetical protein [Deltaproteobacteria bacterium]